MLYNQLKFNRGCESYELGILITIPIMKGCKVNVYIDYVSHVHATIKRYAILIKEKEVIYRVVYIKPLYISRYSQVVCNYN